MTECTWERIGLLDESDCDFSELRNNIGVYKAEYLGDLVYIGKATEHSNGGLRKRLRDYTRQSDSARNYPSGLKMHEHQGELVIFVCSFPCLPQLVQEVNRLEGELIRDLNPPWNALDTTT